MLKYVETLVTFAEVPDEVSLCINISNCKFHCKGCHSPWLWKDEGTELTPEELIKLINANSGISCICIMGGVEEEVQDLIRETKAMLPDDNYKWAWYTGQDNVHSFETLAVLDYAKVGRYKEECGPLNSVTTNQRFFLLKHPIPGSTVLKDITYKFH